MGKRKDGKHARFADQKAARRKANKKSQSTLISAFFKISANFSGTLMADS